MCHPLTECKSASLWGERLHCNVKWFTLYTMPVFLFAAMDRILFHVADATATADFSTAMGACSGQV
jgi:hypothetical protein